MTCTFAKTCKDTFAFEEFKLLIFYFLYLYFKQCQILFLSDFERKNII